MDGFTAKELMDFRNVSIDKLKEARDVWHTYGTSKNTILIIYIIGILCIGLGSYFSYNILSIIGLLSILWAYGKEKELNGYIEGYQAGWDGGTENMQKNIGINVKLIEEIYYENPDL